MTHSPLVSIIIPCFNQARFVREALDSSLAQTYPAVEIILVDDGSTDDLEKSILAYRDNARVKIILQENRGPAAARNNGIRHAQGEFFKFLDADDWLTPNAIAKQRAAFDEVAVQDAHLGFVYSDIMRVDAEGKPSHEYSVATARRVLNGDLFPSLLIGGYFPPLAVLLAGRVLEKVGVFDETLKGTEDWELWLRIAAEGFTGFFVPEKLAYYRTHTTNLSGQSAHMADAERAALTTIVTRYPQRTAHAIHALIEEQARVDRDSAWARETIQAQRAQIESLQRALETRGVRATRAVEQWLKR
jgi:glycosyltransferase involved in cell wall biosynthesis